MSDCIFCKIVQKQIKSKIVYEDKYVLAFEDLNPKAPVHILIIPKKHLGRISDINEGNADLVGKLFLVAKKIAQEKEIEASGYRLIINCNEGAGQEVFHLHLHLLGGRKFSWPPG